MNKKGFNLLGEETVKMIIGALCIAFLALLLFSVYFTYKRSGKLEQAFATLNGPEGIIAYINSENPSSVKEIASPTTWHIYGYITIVPDSCAGEKCICICEKAVDLGGLLGKAQLKKCGEKGVCSKVSNLGKEFDITIESRKVTSISIIKTEQDLIEIKEN